jgi:hypothetical protein
MISTPSMTSRGKRIATFFALIIVALLPKHVECGYPGGECGHFGMFKEVCKAWEVEPLGVFLVEKLLDRDVGFAYKSGEDCR